MFDPSSFTTATAKPLPVVLLLDISASMHGKKIDNLNLAVKEMLETFAQEEKMETEILVSVITFGSEVELYLPYTMASQVQWGDLQAGGMTPMGVALKMAKDMIEDKGVTPSRAYRPTVVIVSDGAPNDSWEKPMNDFISTGRSSKCDRMAMLIGKNSGDTVLKKFIENTEHELFYSDNAGQLHEFFQRVTMSVTMRTQSKNPNLLPAPADIELDSKSVIDNQVSSSDDVGYW